MKIALRHSVAQHAENNVASHLTQHEDNAASHCHAVLRQPCLHKPCLVRARFACGEYKPTCSFIYARD